MKIDTKRWSSWCGRRHSTRDTSGLPVSTLNWSEFQITSAFRWFCATQPISPSNSKLLFQAQISLWGAQVMASTACFSIHTLRDNRVSQSTSLMGSVRRRLSRRVELAILLAVAQLGFGGTEFSPLRCILAGLSNCTKHRILIPREINQPPSAALTGPYLFVLHDTGGLSPA
jgi:hypothetical protein